MNRNKIRSYLMLGIVLIFFGLRDLNNFYLLYDGIVLCLGITLFILAAIGYQKIDEERRDELTSKRRMNAFQKTIHLLLLVIFISSCEGDVGPSGINSLVTTTNELPGLNCAAGGIRIDVGQDANRNTILDSQEIQSTNFVCNGDDGSNVDEVRFSLLTMSGISSTSITPTVTPAYHYITKFKKSNFSSMTSAIVTAHIQTQDPNVSGIVDLFNLTDNVPVPGSEAIANSKEGVWASSGNLLNNFPDKEIDLAIRIRASSQGVYVVCMRANLILSKN